MAVEPTAGWDRDNARLDRAVSQHGVEPYASAEELLAGDVEAVVVASETSLHAELVGQAAAAGKAVILQKPMALTLEDADRITAAVDAAAVPFTMAWQMRVDPENLRIKALLDAGALGRIYQILRRHCLGMLLNPDSNRPGTSIRSTIAISLPTTRLTPSIFSTGFSACRRR